MPENKATLRRGWTTGACATAAAKAACGALQTGTFADPVTITLPGGQTPAFALAQSTLGEQEAYAAIVKDAGDDPDVTHGALIGVRVRRAAPGAGIVYRAGHGVGTVTLPGLPLAPGEPAINPVPRRMIAAALAEVAPAPLDYEVEISVEDGARIATRTLNPRLGIVGGISILGTTGIVVPYSCAAWIDAIHRGIDVARASGFNHVAGATGNTSEKAVCAYHSLDERQMIDMGDFVGGMLKYLRAHPVRRVTVAGGVAKMTKLAQGMLDVHSKRGAADMEMLVAVALELGGSSALGDAIRAANTVAQAFELADVEACTLADGIAERAWRVAAAVLKGSGAELDVLLFDRDGVLRGKAPFRGVD
jgi:cobalt-precorrin-5B (C1)-methyltransferase